MPELDQKAIYDRLDPSGLRGRLLGLPQQCQDGWLQGGDLQTPQDWVSQDLASDNVDKVVVGGMGGSAIAGNLVSNLIAASPAPALRTRPPIIVVRGMEFPFSLDYRSLVVLCSYSGDTGETISLFHKARDSGARVLVVAGGGRLAQEALESGLPFLRVDTLGEPRSAVGYSLMLLAAAFNKLGLANFTVSETTASIALLERRVSELVEVVPTQDNLAKQLALTLKDRVVVVYGGGLFAGMVRRWKTQLNENAKTWAFLRRDSRVASQRRRSLPSSNLCRP